MTHHRVSTLVSGILGSPARITGRHGWVELRVPDGRHQPATTAVAYLEMVLTATDPDGSIRNMISQTVVLPLTDDERLTAMLTGWAEVIAEVCDHTAAFEGAHAIDLWFPKMLKLKRPETAADFAAAARVKSRLGKFLP